MHNLRVLEISLAPSVPASLRNIPTKYNIIGPCVSQTSRISSPRVLHVGPCSRTPSRFHILRLNLLHRIARRKNTTDIPRRIARRSGRPCSLPHGRSCSHRHAGSQTRRAHNSSGFYCIICLSSFFTALFRDRSSVEQSSSTSEKPAARIDDSPSPSVGLAAAKLLSVEPEKERRVLRGTGMLKV
jgi:protein SMG6